VDGADDAVSPRLPPAPPPSLPAPSTPDPSADRPVDPPDPWGGESGADGRVPAEHLATRHVPAAASRTLDLGLPAAAPDSDGTAEFVRPELHPMGDAVAALLVGRLLIVVAAVGVGIAARRSTGVGGVDRAEAFWPVVGSAGVFVLVGLAGLIFWSAQLADNARRLRCRSSSARSMVWSWLLVVAWVAGSCLTYLRLEVGGVLDPLPGVAALGWAFVLALAYGRLQGVFRALSRRPPIVWYSAFAIDVVAIGLVWWRLSAWPSPVDADTASTTADVVFGAAVALALNVLVFAWLAQRGSDGIFERLGRLEARSRGDEALRPDWFRSGLSARPDAEPSPAVQRSLIGTRVLGAVVAACHVVWGVGLVAIGVLVGKLALDYSDRPVFLDDRLVVADRDIDRLELGLVLVGLAYVVAVTTHGVWAVLSAVNARRVTVHSPNPATFVLAFAPMPLLVGAGLIVGGVLGYWLVMVGLTIAFFALILVNKMLMALSARLGGDLAGFGRWSLCIVLTYVAGVVVNVLFARSAAQLGLYATVGVIQGALIIAGGVIGFGATRELDTALRSHRQVRRA
jgi:hypothetical protein